MPLIVIGVAKLVPFLKEVTYSQLAAGLLATVFASYGTYRVIANALSALLRRSYFVKKFVLGSACLHGTWAGAILTPGESPRLVVEYFEQDMERLVIRGFSYTEGGEEDVQWVSEATAIDAARGRLIYAYTSDIIRRRAPHQGMAVFQFDRETSFGPPHAIDGYAADLVNGKRYPAYERKVSDALIDRREAIAHARSYLGEVRS